MNLSHKTKYTDPSIAQFDRPLLVKFTVKTDLIFESSYHTKPAYDIYSVAFDVSDQLVLGPYAVLNTVKKRRFRIKVVQYSFSGPYLKF